MYFRHKSRTRQRGGGQRPIVPHTDLQSNIKVAMSRLVSTLEAFRYIPTDGSFAPSADRLSTCTKCPNLRFLSYNHWSSSAGIIRTCTFHFGVRSGIRVPNLTHYSRKTVISRDLMHCFMISLCPSIFPRHIFNTFRTTCCPGPIG